MKYFLHIGPHKTGTTYIQRECVTRRTELLNLGIHYPAIWNDQLYSHLGIYHQLRQGHNDFFAANFAQFLADAPNAEYALISSENLEELSQEAIGILARHFTPSETKIIYYARRWQPLLYSLWQEYIKHGGVKILPEYLMEETNNYFSNPGLNYNIVLDKFANVYGADNVIVRSYDNLTGSGENLFNDIVSVITETKSSLSEHNYLTNQAFNILDIEIVRILNSIFYSKYKIEDGSRIRDIYVSIKDNYQESLVYLRENLDGFVREIGVPYQPERFLEVESVLLNKYKNVGPIMSGNSLFEQHGGEDSRIDYYVSEILFNRDLYDILNDVVSRIEKTMNLN